MNAIPAPPPVPTVPLYFQYKDSNHPVNKDDRVPNRIQNSKPYVVLRGLRSKLRAHKDDRVPNHIQNYKPYVESLLHGLRGACVQTFRGKQAAPPHISGMIVVASLPCVVTC